MWDSLGSLLEGGYIGVTCKKGGYRGIFTLKGD